ncbi:MAG: hypothetical protein RLZZ394_769 [Actinomycetota bacterium]
MERKEEMALSEGAVLQGLKEILEEVVGIKPGDVESSKDFSNDLDVDSLSMVEVVVAAEERFGIKIPDEAVSDMKTVGDAVAYIVKAAA